MSLFGILSVADSGIADIGRALQVVGQNVTNVATPGWTREVATHESATVGGVGLGVRRGPITRATQPQLQAAVLAQAAVTAAAQQRSDTLSGVDAAQGTTGSKDDMAGLLATLQGRFVALQQDPANAAARQAVVGAASDFASRLNAVSDAVGQARQAAQDGAVAQVAALNTGLARIGGLSRQIAAATAAGQDAADLANQRDAAVSAIATILPVQARTQADGGMLLVSGGLVLPTDGAARFSLVAAGTSAQVAYPATLPGVTLGGRDVTAQIGGGALGADLALRDATLPAQQAGLDQFAQTVALRFQGQGLRLFTDMSGSVPQSVAAPTQSGFAGFAGTIMVNPAVTAAPSLVRDGTDAIAGGPGGAGAFTPNPPGGPAGDTTLIARILRQTFGTEQQPGVAQPSPPTSGLGVTGTLALPYSPPATIAQFAASVTGALASDVAQAAGALSDATALGTTLSAKLQTGSGVSIDTEMSTMVTLQNAYAANAKVMGAVQSMWSDLLGMLR